MSEAATGGVLRKKVFFKMSQNPQQTPVPGETSVNFAKLLRTLFSQNTSNGDIVITKQEMLIVFVVES